MIQFEPKFVKGMLGRFAIASALAVAIAIPFWGIEVAVSIVIGNALMTGNVIVMSWFLRKMLGASEGGGGKSSNLVTVFLLKLLVLFGLTYYVLAVVGVDPLGLVSGFMLGLAVLSWQVIRGGASTESESAQDADSEEE